MPGTKSINTSRHFHWKAGIKKWLLAPLRRSFFDFDPFSCRVAGNNMHTAQKDAQATTCTVAHATERLQETGRASTAPSFRIIRFVAVMLQSSDTEGLIIFVSQLVFLDDKLKR
jgi:hypothetical protein